MTIHPFPRTSATICRGVDRGIDWLARWTPVLKHRASIRVSAGCFSENIDAADRATGSARLYRLHLAQEDLNSLELVLLQARAALTVAQAQARREQRGEPTPPEAA